jgi:hypothetical protein
MRKKIIAILSVLFCASLIFAGCSAGDELKGASRSKIPLSISGNWISENGQDYIEFISSEKYARYKIKNNEISKPSKGNYFFNSNGDRKLLFLPDPADVDDAGSEYKIVAYGNEHFVLKIHNKNVFYNKVKSGSKKAKKIAGYKKEYVKTQQKIKAEQEKKEAAERAKNAPKEASFGAGNYTCGTSFNPGTYNISRISGMGNVYCTSNGLNEVFGPNTEYNQICNYSNVTFYRGETLRISGSVTIRLTPSGK